MFPFNLLPLAMSDILIGIQTVMQANKHLFSVTGLANGFYYYCYCIFKESFERVLSYRIDFNSYVQLSTGDMKYQINCHTLGIRAVDLLVPESGVNSVCGEMFIFSLKITWNSIANSWSSHD